MQQVAVRDGPRWLEKNPSILLICHQKKTYFQLIEIAHSIPKEVRSSAAALAARASLDADRGRAFFGCGGGDARFLLCCARPHHCFIHHHLFFTRPHVCFVVPHRLLRLTTSFALLVPAWCSFPPHVALVPLVLGLCHG